jgi:hypothetical protein
MRLGVGCWLPLSGHCDRATTRSLYARASSKAGAKLDPLYALQLRSAAQELANPYPRTPAMAAGVTDHVWTMTQIAGLLD